MIGAGGGKRRKRLREQEQQQTEEEKHASNTIERFTKRRRNRHERFPIGDEM